jgi:hypothetical protein
MWYAALPELLVFCFVLLSFLAWVRWLQSETKARAAYWCSFAFFLLALLSKESAVVVPPLLILAGVVQRRRIAALLLRVLPFAFCAAAYFALIYAARNTHLHFQDAGTFSLHAPFVRVLLRSTKGLMWFWGFAAATALFVWKVRDSWKLLCIAATWTLITLLPYCFLTYMPVVPSRHTYMASLGLSLLIAVALIEYYWRTWISHGHTAVAIVAAIIVLQQCSYLWTVKHSQFQIRARPTEQLLRLAAEAHGPIHVSCFPYDKSVADLALRIRHPESGAPALVFDPPGSHHEGDIDFCLDYYGGGRTPLSAESSAAAPIAP